jgi:hypothetical protein
MTIPYQSEHHPPVWFPGWAEELQRMRLPPLIRQQYRTALLQYLRFCKQSHQRATVDSARQFMQEVEAQRRLGVSQLATWKEALRWFFREAQQQPGEVGRHGPARRLGTTARAAQRSAPTNVMTDVPTLGAADLGKTDWERRLVDELRGRHYRWRTEQTYREWAWRFARWLEGRAPSRPNPGGGDDRAWPSRRLEQASSEDVRKFLTDAATTQIHLPVMRKPGLGVRSPLDA